VSTAVVTGLGVIAPTGLGRDAYWSATLEGTSGIRRITRFDPDGYPVRLAGEVPDFTAGEHLPSRLLPQTDRMTQLALAAADWALADAGLTPEDVSGYQAGVVTASASGGFEFGHRELENLWARGPQYVSAYQSFAWFYAVNTGQISIRHGLRGPSGVLVSDQAGGLDAVAQARRVLRNGTPIMVTGGVDASLCPWGWVAQMSTGRMSTVDDEQRAYLPFDAGACGYLPGEGGAILVLEDLEQVDRERDADQLWGEIAGYAATFDPRPGTGRPPALRRAIELALSDAGCVPEDVDVVFADGAADPAADRLEAEALEAVFGPFGVPVTVPKTMTGRLYSGAGALDVATALLSLRHGVIPPTVHVEHVAYPIDLVREARPAPLKVALVLARGRGGFNSAMVVRAAA
jgi:act minimal PKS chain-length factor (CLF/KS beta)